MRFEAHYLGQCYEGECGYSGEDIWIETLDISPLELDERIVKSGLDSHQFLRGLNEAVRYRATIQLSEMAAQERAEDRYIAEEWKNASP